MVYISTVQSAVKNARDVGDKFGTAVRVLASEEWPNKRVETYVAVQQIARDIEDERRAGVRKADRIQLVLGLDDHVWMEICPAFPDRYHLTVRGSAVVGVAVLRLHTREAAPPALGPQSA